MTQELLVAPAYHEMGWHYPVLEEPQRIRLLLELEALIEWSERELEEFNMYQLTQPTGRREI